MTYITPIPRAGMLEKSFCGVWYSKDEAGNISWEFITRASIGQEIT